MNEIRLPRSAAASSPRTLTGTIVFRRSGSAPRATMKSRTPPAHTASTASLSVVPNDRLIVFRSSSGRESSASRRSGEIGSFSSGAGGAGSSDSASAPAARRASSAKPSSFFGRRTALAGPASIPACPATRSRTPPAMRGSATRRGARRPAARGRERRDRGSGRAAARPARPPRCRRPGSGGPCPRRRSGRRQLVGDPQLPQRPLPVERHGERHVGQLANVVRGAVKHVVGDVEVLGVHPFGRVEAQRDAGQALAVARRAAQAARDVVAQLVERRHGPVGRGQERRHPADVHVGGGALDLQERCVERGQSGRRRHGASPLFRDFVGAFPETPPSTREIRPCA